MWRYFKLFTNIATKQKVYGDTVIWNPRILFSLHAVSQGCSQAPAHTSFAHRCSPGSGALFWRVRRMWASTFSWSVPCAAATFSDSQLGAASNTGMQRGPVPFIPPVLLLTQFQASAHFGDTTERKTSLPPTVATSTMLSTYTASLICYKSTTWDSEWIVLPLNSVVQFCYWAPCLEYWLFTWLCTCASIQIPPSHVVFQNAI